MTLGHNCVYSVPQNLRVGKSKTLLRVCFTVLGVKPSTATSRDCYESTRGLAEKCRTHDH